MARIVFWAKRDNDHPDPLIDREKYKAGMTVDVLEDGREAGKEIEAGAWWRIVEVPGVPAAEFKHLVVGDRETPTFDPKKDPTPRKRLYRCDLDTIEGPLKGIFPARTIKLTKLEVLATETEVLRLSHPNVVS